jgi:hypothetical protein
MLEHVLRCSNMPRFANGPALVNLRPSARIVGRDKQSCLLAMSYVHVLLLDIPGFDDCVDKEAKDFGKEEGLKWQVSEPCETGCKQWSRRVASHTLR